MKMLLNFVKLKEINVSKKSERVQSQIGEFIYSQSGVQLRVMMRVMMRVWTMKLFYHERIVELHSLKGFLNTINTSSVSK